jgi:Rod binding domain-containing protein
MTVPALKPIAHAADLPLEKLAGNTHVPEREKVSELCRQFEAVLLRQILREANKTVIRSEFKRDTAVNGIYQDMLNGHLADCISRSGTLRFAESLEKDLTRHLPASPDPPDTRSAGQPSDTSAPRSVHRVHHQVQT